MRDAPGTCVTSDTQTPSVGAVPARLGWLEGVPASADAVDGRPAAYPFDAVITILTLADGGPGGATIRTGRTVYVLVRKAHRNPDTRRRRATFTAKSGKKSRGRSGIPTCTSTPSTNAPTAPVVKGEFPLQQKV